MSVEELADSMCILRREPNLAKLDKCRPMIVKQSRIRKMLRWLINESKKSAHSAVSFDGDCTARSTHWFRPGCAQPDLSSFCGGFSFDFDFGFRLGCSPSIGSTNSGWRLSRARQPSDKLVLSKLWPHLDPFGLVGFCVERNLKTSLDEQVNHLLNLYDSDFDANHVFRQLAFRVPTEKVARIGAALLEIEMDIVSEMIKKKSKDAKRYKATTEAEKQINRILAEGQSFGDKPHGTTAQMLGYANAFGMYTLFFTVNPADLHSPLR
ncbi:BQ5605_C013g07184 [Microbotryum silenes-dioicae]|uniref:BQ5605_C013g07184 protein n=1 Tax=Microbotryum silenes-dioicae TaxID=796604 RepID=A0A2X0MCE6_9BASI|nr:BQ5605_C013g07184 [Microbotryum silenes-dioicae]